MSFTKILEFTRRNYFISLFLIIILFVGAVSVYKLFLNPSQTYVYAKMKLGQGLWWASGAKPSIWLAKGIVKGDTEKDLLGKNIVEVLGVRYYPYYTSDQYDVYLTLKLKVGGNTKRKTYSFKRSNIGVGSPIELELPAYQVSGTITEISDQPIEDTYVEKIVNLVKQNAYPWEYDGIKIGDIYFDGENNVFEVLDKTASDITGIFSQKTYTAAPITSESRKYITVKAKIITKVKDKQLIFGEDQVIRIGKIMNISTPNFTFDTYVIGKIE